MSALVVDVAADAADMARRAATFICELVEKSTGPHAICLSGGGTPRGLYELLTTPPFRDRLPWPDLHWFLGDERFVPPTDERSNFRMIRAALLSRAPIPDANVHAMPTTNVTLQQAADFYAKELQDFYGSPTLRPDKPLFDAVILGLGPDGHTASLLPGQPEQNERTRWVCGAPKGAPEPRLTLTVPVLESARGVLFLVAGADKRKAFAKLRAGDRSIPSAQIQPAGLFRAFVDHAVVDA